MLRFLKVFEGKPISIVNAGAALKRGALCVKAAATEDVTVATATQGFFFVDAVPNYDGMNSIYTPTDGSFEDIASGAKCLQIEALVGEVYATTELTLGAAVVGDYMKASAGKFIEGATNDVCEWIYKGTYADPTGLTMYKLEKCAPHTVV